MHPTIKAKELKIRVLNGNLAKQGYAIHQLFETSRNTKEGELREFLDKSTQQVQQLFRCDLTPLPTAHMQQHKKF